MMVECFQHLLVRHLRGEDLTMFGDGSQTRSFCYVDDLVEGIYRIVNERLCTANEYW
jgi:UDP-glucuronate decarboxylase